MTDEQIIFKFMCDIGNAAYLGNQDAINLCIGILGNSQKMLYYPQIINNQILIDQMNIKILNKSSIKIIEFMQQYHMLTLLDFYKENNIISKD
jgi:hypothetical protein